MKTGIFALFAVLASVLSAGAEQYESAIHAYLEDNVAHWAADPILIAAIKKQNSETSAYDQARIDYLDSQWRIGLYAENDPLVQDVLSNDASEYLRNQVSISEGAITEVILMDAQGLNVAASTATTDYWQGDEAKFQKTYLVGNDAVHLGSVELDESTGTVQGQISMTLVDAETGVAVGAITVGVDLNALL